MLSPLSLRSSPRPNFTLQTLWRTLERQLSSKEEELYINYPNFQCAKSFAQLLLNFIVSNQLKLKFSSSVRKVFDSGKHPKGFRKLFSLMQRQTLQCHENIFPENASLILETPISECRSADPKKFESFIKGILPEHENEWEWSTSSAVQDIISLLHFESVVWNFQDLIKKKKKKRNFCAPQRGWKPTNFYNAAGYHVLWF